MRWVYLALELSIIFSLGFLHVYMMVMRRLGVTWAFYFDPRPPGFRHTEIEVRGTSNSRIPHFFQFQTLPHHPSPKDAVKENGVASSSFSPRRDVPSHPAKVSGRAFLSSGKWMREPYRNYSARVR